MAELKYINPDTNQVLSGNDIQKLSPGNELLRVIAIDHYNQALELADNGNYHQSWKIIKSSIEIFPFINKTLDFGFYVSLHMGEYDKSAEYLLRLKPLVEDNEYSNYLVDLKANIECYNNLLDLDNYDQYDVKELSYIHLFLLSIIKPENKEIKEGLNYYDSRYKYSTDDRNINFYYVIGAVAIFSLSIILLYNNNSITKDKLAASKSFQESLSAQILVIENNKNRLLDFMSYFNAGDFIRCGKLLSEDIDLVNYMISLNLENIIEKTTLELYEKYKDYNTIIKISFETDYHIHAYWKLCKSDNIGKEKFVLKYPLSYMYTPSIIRELFDAENDIDKRKKYALQMKENITVNLVYKNQINKFYSLEMKKYIEN